MIERRKLRQRITTWLAATLVGAIAFFWLLEVVFNGLPFSSACNAGWRATQQESRISALQVEFHEKLPPTATVETFSCSGFQDLMIEARLTMPHEDGVALQKALDRTLDTPQNNRYLPENRKSRKTTTFPGRIETSYVLPASGILYVRDVRIIVPEDASQKVIVEFTGSQW